MRSVFQLFDSELRMPFDEPSVIAAHSLIALFLVVGCAGPQKKDGSKPTQSTFRDRKLRYRIALEDDRLHVTTEFRGHESGKTTFALPNERGGQKKLFRGVRDFRVEGSRVEVREGSKPHLRVLTHDPNAVLEIRYEVVQTFDQEYKEHRFRPIVTDSGAYFIGETVLGRPEHMHVGLEREVVFDWNELEENQVAVHSLDTERSDGGRERVETAIGAVRNALYLVGDVREFERSIRGSKVRFAGFGELPAGPDTVIPPVIRILRAQRTFWNEYDLPPYLVGLFGVDDCCWAVGDSVYHGFASIIAHRNTGPMRSHVVRLVSHEHLHRWIPSRLGAPRPFRAYVWFIEGFTQYYTRRFKLQTGFIDFERYVNAINTTLEKYWESPVRNADRSRVQAGFRKKPALTRLPYQRGEILALNWNAEIVEATGGKKSLDDVMHALKRKHDADDAFRISDKAIAETVAEIAPGVDVTKALERVVDRGETISPTKGALGPCAKLRNSRDDDAPEFAYDAKTAESTDCLEWFR